MKNIILLPTLLSILAASSTAVADKPPEPNNDIQNQECIAPNSDGECTALDSSSVYVIGDLHGDAICAVSWVNRTGLIANLLDEESSSSSSSTDTATVPLFKKLKNSSEWKWTNDKATLVFMGDYVDKGPTSKQVVEFVKQLTDSFPDKVTAILGNHELELLRDRDARIAPVDRYSAYSYATVHPGEYHNYFNDPKQQQNIVDADSKNADSSTNTSESPAAATATRDLDKNDDLVLDLLYEAGMEVYTARAHSAVRFVPSLPEHTDTHRKRGIMYAITDIFPPQYRVLARERLAEYIDAYLNTYRSGTVLGNWVEQRPIIHLAEDVRTVFVHGGVSPNVGMSHLSQGKISVEKLNKIWRENSHEGKLYDFLNGRGMELKDIMGHVVYELLTYRGNHPGYGKWESHGTFDEDEGDSDKVCEILHDMLSHMEGIDRIAVGHTPDDNIRIMCDGAFMALDSTLGRWIRGSGNEYCPGPEHFENRKGVDVPRTSRDGKYRCDEIKAVCEGQIVRLDSDGSVNVITM
eukprot:CAMPEP_0201683896 /NCGR_PEP_ID=MMETSP0494-20130426/52361_1 /ASSEMBLY_ACC=CAM_ASM_000839 /TAXON_ID=420259 /ORGANISM="Thalassiosira gravida, Strain GMp14c1" /LENGTH=521 /DNA_ID=CAMNT_0048167683 /DNA_START=244 /DNA_END=1809 /DNA_ORIENTATION=+